MSLISLLSVLAAILTATAVRGATLLAPRAEPTKFVTLDIVNGPVAPDGFTRIGVLANGTFPGPPIIATKGQTLVVRVNNKLTDETMRLSTSINFDGLFLDSDNIFNDGTAFVNTCPIGPGASYTYTLPLGEQTGSYWYHSQVGVQYADGLRGTIVIYVQPPGNIDPDDPLRHLYDVDDESTILTIADWFHNTSTSLLTSYLATQVNPVPDDGLFNARGRFNGGPEVEFAAVAVSQGKRYRFRLINIAARSNFVQVIEADGTPTQPNEVDVLVIHAGQRYSFVVNANQPVGNYWINAFINGGTKNPNINSTFSRGILRYAGAPQQEPQTPMIAPSTGPGIRLLNESTLVPFHPTPAPEPDFNLTFRTFMPEGLTQWEINNVSYVPPSVPTLVRVLEGETQQGDFNMSENTFVFPANKTIQVEFMDPVNEGHPFHLHGMQFWVVKSNSTNTINTVNPIRRDVVITGNNTLIIRFRTDKPGPWPFHCHILYHFAVGLGSVIGAGLDEVKKTVHPTSAWERLCPAYDALPPEEQ
ncbi:laccase subfamily 2 [Mycena amicta]|nr:laccase subfamily 2 [Mycena amicta]